MTEVDFRDALLNSLSSAVIAIDGNGAILYWNRCASELFGPEGEEVTGRQFSDFVAETNASRTMLDRLRRLQSDEGELVACSASGADVQLAVQAHAMHAASGALIGVLLQAERVGERLRTEAEQRLLAEVGAILSNSLQSEAILDRVCRLLVPELADMCTFYTVDPDDSVRTIAAAYSGNDLTEVFKQLDAERDEMGAPSPIAAILRDGGSRLFEVDDIGNRAMARSPRELELLRATGFRSAIAIALQARGRTIGAIGLARNREQPFDQRHLRLAEEIARRAAVHVDNQRLYEAAVLANKSKSDFLAVISHELRTPLTTIMGYAELMASGVPEKMPPKASEFLGRVRTAAWHLLGLIEQILVYARLEAGRENLMPVTIVVPQLLNDVRALVEPNALEKGLGFTVDSSDPELTFTSDLIKVRQIMLNLASNAVKFTNEGEIHLRARAEGQDIVMSVQDTGIGISPENSERIFDAFWQVDQSDTRKVGGAGLGLSVSRRLARLLGGDMSMSSLPGGGTLFEVRLPSAWRPREELARGA